MTSRKPVFSQNPEFSSDFSTMDSSATSDFHDKKAVRAAKNGNAISNYFAAQYGGFPANPRDRMRVVISVLWVVYGALTNIFFSNLIPVIKLNLLPVEVMWVLVVLYELQVITFWNMHPALWWFFDPGF